MLLFTDLSTGASGDKLMGALLEVAEQTSCYDLEALSADLSSLVDGLVLKRVLQRSGSLMATHITVDVEADQPHRSWSHIRALIENAPLTDGAQKRAIASFSLVADAEAEVHGVSVEEVHFHEVGACDSIADIVGVSILLDAIAPDAFYATPLALGSGTVQCAHGTLPVPAPATARIIVNSQIPCCSGAFSCELTTPTGAALIAANATSFSPLPVCTPVALGLGSGTRDLEGTPNTITALAAEMPPSSLSLEQVMLLETNLDHITPEQTAYAAKTILDAGACDVWEDAYCGKKGRMGFELHVLCDPEHTEEFATLTHRLTGSLGIRRRLVTRSVLTRHQLELDTPYGTIRYKAARIDDVFFIRPEFDDTARVASDHPEQSYEEIYQELSELGRRSLPMFQRPSDS